MHHQEFILERDTYATGVGSVLKPKQKSSSKLLFYDAFNYN